MPSLAFTISSYRLVDFVRLGLAQLSKLSPESRVLVSDDHSAESGHIEKAALERSAEYRGSRVRRSHFAGDLQSFVNAIAFAEAAGADVAVKISQRFILRKPEVVTAIMDAFSDPNILVVTPGQPKVSFGFGKPTNGFGAFTVLSDIVAIRVGCISPTELLHLYRGRLVREKVPWASFLECTIDDMCQNRFPGRTIKLEAITNQQDLEDPLYLRRYQNSEEQYRNLAATHGIGGRFPTGEWAQLEGKSYLCRPMVV